MNYHSNTLNVLPKLFLQILFLGMAIVCFLLPPDAYAINRLDTKYFTIIYDHNGEYTAGEIAKFCDDIYEKLMAHYDAFEDNPHITCLVNDAVDLANGYAIYFQNTITIYATNMDFELRGQSNWLKNVFVHEMTHMVSLKKASRGPINLMGLSGGKYNDNPDININIALYHLSQPAWFSEGTAQVGAETFGSERWDTHRDMLLRSAWYEKSLLTFDAMSVLSGQKGMDAELVYNQGYAMVRYIKEKYGYDKVIGLNNSSGYFDFNPTIKKVLGISARKLYADWHKSLDERYSSFKERQFDGGVLVKDNGSSDYFPVVSPDGQYLAWLSNRGKDYAITDLMLTNLSTGKTRKLVKFVDYRVAWSHDSKKLLYVKRPPKRPQFYDIYTYDIQTETEKRISKQLRATDPSFSPGDSLVVFVRNEGGNNSLAVIDSNGSGLQYLTATHDGTQFYRPSFSPDGTKIIFGLYKQGLDRDIGMIDAHGESYRYEWDLADSTGAFSDSTSFAEGSNFKLLLGAVHDERDPWFLPDGSGILYASDRTGVFNLYKLDLTTNKTTRLTDVYGGAFCPTAGSNGEIYYSGYKARNFSIYRTSLDNELEEDVAVVEDRDYLVQPDSFKLSDYFSPRPFARKRILNAIVPTLNVGPSFIGSRFGLNVINLGVEIYVSDLLGQDAFTISGYVGKNLKQNVSINNSVQVYYQKRLVPITSSSYTHSPTLFASAARSEIHNYITRFEGTIDTTYYADIPDLGYANVLHDLRQDISIADIYRHEFRFYNMGIHIPLAPRHNFVIEAGYRNYIETLRREEKYRDMSTFMLDGTDISNEVEGTGTSWGNDLNFFNDLEFFQSKEFSIGYNYFKMEPAADAQINPHGTALFFRFKHMQSAVADSLLEQVSLFVPVGMYQDGSFALEQYTPDELLDTYRPYKKKTDINEYLIFLQRNQKLPKWRHSLNGTVLIGYKDVYLKDAFRGEGSGYNWPLKYYLGGRMLSGYPYFSFWGSKMAYSRFDYVFPIREKIAKNLFGLHFQRLYGNVFFEAAKTWNFKKLTMDRIREGAVKRDIGFELRLKMVSFYRLSTFFMAKIVWPLDDMGDSPYRDRRDARRYYFELRM